MARADLMSVECQRGVFCYLHFGIDIGDGTVVHLATELEKREMSVQRVSIDQFANGAPISIEAVEEELSADAVIERTLAAVGQKGYDLVIGNCEHFARQMKTGKGHSVQVDRFVRSAVRTAFSGFVSTARRHVIAGSLTAISQSRFLVTAGSIVPTLIGETARQGAYLAARKLKMTHAEAERSSRSVGHAACALGGFIVGGPMGSAGALAISVASDHLTDSIQKQFSTQN